MNHPLEDDDFVRLVANAIPNEIDDIHSKYPPPPRKIKLHSEEHRVAPEDKAEYTAPELQDLKDYGAAYAAYRLRFYSDEMSAIPSLPTLDDFERKQRGRLGEQPGQPEARLDELFAEVRTIAENQIALAIHAKRGGGRGPKPGPGMMPD